MLEVKLNGILAVTGDIRRFRDRQDLPGGARRMRISRTGAPAAYWESRRLGIPHHAWREWPGLWAMWVAALALVLAGIATAMAGSGLYGVALWGLGGVVAVVGFWGLALISRWQKGEATKLRKTLRDSTDPHYRSDAARRLLECGYWGYIILQEHVRPTVEDSVEVRHCAARSLVDWAPIERLEEALEEELGHRVRAVLQGRLDELGPKQ